jgi:hypothetical protein
VSTIAAATVFGASGGVATAAGDGDKNSLLAAAQFELFVLSTTDFIPTDVACTPPPDRDANGAMLCYALISDRVSVAAIATMESPGVYTFTPINKVDPAELEPVTPAQTEVVAPDSEQAPTVPGSPDTPSEPEMPAPSPQNAADEQVLNTIDGAVTHGDELGGVLLGNNESIDSVEGVTYHAPTSTMQVSVTTSATDVGVRDTLAFYVTDVMAYLWERSEPFRDPEATIRPRLEVTVDGEVYGSAFDVMVGVADYTISQTEWIEIVTGGGARSTDSRSIETVTRKPRRDTNPHLLAAAGKP